MPIDLALPLYLSGEDGRYRRSPEPCSNPTLTFAPPKGYDHHDSNHASHKKGKKDQKKRVSFADHRGLSLTRVKTFSDSKDAIEIPPSVRALFTSISTLEKEEEEEEKLVLEFAQPSADYGQFRQRLAQHAVCLEHCVLRERSLAGTVRVQNLSPCKSVHVRVTFDSWRSHDDVACSYVLSTYPDSESDTFSFEVPLPAGASRGPKAPGGPDRRIEFAIRYEENSREHWDSNQGENYRVARALVRPGKRRQSVLGMHFDPYGSPTCSHGLFPNWPSYAAYENMGPYY